MTSVRLCSAARVSWASSGSVSIGPRLTSAAAVMLGHKSDAETLVGAQLDLRHFDLWSWRASVYTVAETRRANYLCFWTSYMVLRAQRTRGSTQKSGEREARTSEPDRPSLGTSGYHLRGVPSSPVPAEPEDAQDTLAAEQSLIDTPLHTTCH